MNPQITGLHHITAISSDAQKNLEFYAGILGLRMVKKTINYDAPDVYHLYYGNEHGHPGTVLTFFPFHGTSQGTIGKGQIGVISFSIAEGAIEYWMKRLKKFHIPFEKPESRFGETALSFKDHDGLALELVANKDTRPGFINGNIPLDFAIKGFHGMTLFDGQTRKTSRLLTELMNHEMTSEKGARTRYSSSGKPGDFVDVIFDSDRPRGNPGYGTVHHAAFKTPDNQTQLEAREKLLHRGLNVTPVINRQYFHSVYFREPGGALFEIATISPGFTIDEPLEHLGETLKLPPWEEPNRVRIEASLVPIHLDIKRFSD